MTTPEPSDPEPYSDQYLGLLNEVLANPDDDTPRLIFADYLEEVGDPRDEFIRLQCELEHLDPCDPSYLDRSHRCDDLLAENRIAWVHELKQDVKKAAFARGFIDRITMLAREFIKDGDALYRSTPVNWLRLNYVKGKGAQLAKTDALTHVRSLDLSGLVIPDEDLSALLMSSNLDNLRRLKLDNYDTDFSAAIGMLLPKAPSASTLEFLQLPGGSKFLNAIGSGDGFPNLSELVVGTTYNYESVGGLAQLHVPKLKKLKMRGTIQVADCEALSRLPLAQLEALDLSMTRVPAKGLALLADRGALDQARNVDLSACGLGTRAAKVLFSGERLGNCVDLDLGQNRELGVTSKSSSFITSMAAHQPLRNLKRLRISGLNPSHLQQLFESDAIAQLEFLELNASSVSAADLSALVDSPSAATLRHLRLVECDAEPDAFSPLCRTGVLPSLIRLELDTNFNRMLTIDERMNQQLVQSEAFPALQSVSFDYLMASSKILDTIASHSNWPDLRQISFCNGKSSRATVDAVMNSPRLPKLSRLILVGTTGLGRRDKIAKEYGNRVDL